jgi:subtilase family serine protease
MTELLLQCKEKENKVQVVPGLKPGESFRHEFQHKWYTLGTKKCTARVDFRNKIDERDESNNQAELSVHIK